jgi:hypothetical protein
LKEKVRGSTSVKATGHPVGTAESLTEALEGIGPFVIHSMNQNCAIGELESGFQRISQSPQNVVAHHQPVDHNIDVVFLCFGQGWNFCEAINLAINASPSKIPGNSGCAADPELAFTTHDHRRRT